MPRHANLKSDFFAYREINAEVAETQRRREKQIRIPRLYGFCVNSTYFKILFIG